MKTVKVAPGIYRIDMSDEERRRKFRVRREWVDAIRGEQRKQPVTQVIREIFDVQGDHDKARPNNR